MAENKLAGPIKLCKQLRSYNVFSVVLVFSMLGLGHILISDLVVASVVLVGLILKLKVLLVHIFYFS